MSLIEQDSPIKGVLRIRLNRPDKRNALNIDLMEELTAAIHAANEENLYRVLILVGSGSCFSSGLDLSEAKDENRIEKSTQTYARLLKNLYRSSLITIAAVHGAVFAGGAGLMLACDFAVATKEAQFGFPEVRRGIVAAQVMTLLMRQLKLRDVQEITLTGETFGAEKALSMGLLSQIVAEDSIEESSFALAKTVLLGSPGAVMETKRLIETLYPSSFSDDLYQSVMHHHKVRHSSEAKEGMQAFLEKRKPRWES